MIHRIQGWELGVHECHCMVRRVLAEALERLGCGSSDLLLLQGVAVQAVAAGEAGVAEVGHEAGGSVSEASPSLEARERWAAAEPPPLPGSSPPRLPPSPPAAPADATDVPVMHNNVALPPPNARSQVASPDPRSLHAVEQLQQYRAVLPLQPMLTPSMQAAASLVSPQVPSAQPTAIQEASRTISLGRLVAGSRCNLCSKKVSEDFGGLICWRQRKNGGEAGGCREGVCWRCMKRAPRDSFGDIRTNKEEFESWGDDAWWMHEGCMRDSDWADYMGEAADDAAAEEQKHNEAGQTTATADLPQDPLPSCAGVSDTAEAAETDELPLQVEAMSVRQLKEILAEKRVDCTDCIEKLDLIKRVRTSLEADAVKVAVCEVD